MKLAGSARRRRGVTLIEMMIVVALIALVSGIAYPSFSAGIDTMRLNQAASGVVNFFNEALNRAERRGQAVSITVNQGQGLLTMHSAEPGFEKRLELPQGVSIVKVLPEATTDGEENQRQFVLYPGGAVPQVGIQIANQRHSARTVRVDAITGVPRIERSEAP